MKLIERYALAMGAKIDRPEINTKFYPIKADKYITFNAASTNMPAKNYFYWQEVINIIAGELKKNEIEIIQLGDANEPEFAGVTRLNGQLSIAQSAYVIQNAALHFGVDSMLIHIADTFNVPIVGLYSVSPPSICGPSFGDKKKQILIEPNFKEGENYYYNPQGPNVVNSIKIEQITNAISKLIGVEFQKIKTQHIGGNYANLVIEVVPDGVLPPQVFPGAIPTVRFDLGGVEEVVYQQLHTRKSAVFTTKPLNVEVLKQLRPNLERIVYEIDENYSKDFIKNATFAGMPLVVLTDIPEEKTDLIKLELSDYCIVHRKPKGKKPEGLVLKENTYFKSQKILFANGKTYLSLSHYRGDKEVTDGSNIGKVIDTEEFFIDESFYLIYDRVNE